MENLLAVEHRPSAAVSIERFCQETEWATNPKIPLSVMTGGLEFSRYMTHQLLRDTDALSMAHSLEVRTPLVDIEVVHAAFQHLGQTHAGDGFPKWGLRQTLDRPLPREVVCRPKQGFVFPWNEWLKGKVLADFDRQLADCTRWKSFLDPRGLQTCRQAYQRNEVHWSQFWGLYVLVRMMG